jgi:hypothetical protein
LSQPASATNTELKNNEATSDPTARGARTVATRRSHPIQDREQTEEIAESSKAEFDNNTTLFPKSRKIGQRPGHID